ncbi:MAG: GntR family transcriptional regulator, partial [Erysipelotrichaceae bacterium]|nr:GntR family transcriptional regulator [Erysipelotrichaceae bacterium]
MEEALYKTIADKLMNDIENGQYQKGDILPTEAKLGGIFNVSRVTVRQAIDILVAKNYVKKIRGSGTHVIYSKKDAILDRSSKIISFSEEMRLLNKKSSSKIIEFKLVKATPEIIAELALENDAMVLYYERVLYGDEFPYCF